MTIKKFRGRQGRTHRVVSEHHGGQDGWYDDPKKKEILILVFIEQSAETL
jgi:hypothetical protein